MNFRIFVLGMLCASTTVFSEELPPSVIKECTTTNEIYHKSVLLTDKNITKEQIRTAVLKALGKSTSNPSYTVHNFKGQWFYERETDDAIFAGYKIRSHYLNIAIVYTTDGLVTIICNSDNLDQSYSSIHRKAPLWKGTLDSRVRIEVGNITITTKKSDVVTSEKNKAPTDVTTLHVDLVQFRSKLKEGDDTHCGLVVETKKEIIKIDTQIGEKWLKRSQIYAPKMHECVFINGVYQE